MLFHKVRLHGCNPLHDTRVTSDDTRERLFLVAVEVIELNYKLRTDPRTRPWLWFFSSYTQWHAFSLVLVWLQTNPLCKGSRRAWEAVEKAIVLRWEHPPSLLNGRKPKQWRSIIRLLEKARSARREALRKRNTRRGSQYTNDLMRASTMASLDSSSSSAVAAAQESWTGASLVSQGPQAQQTFQTQQRQTVNESATNPAGTLTPSAIITDVSSSGPQLNAMMPSPWTRLNQNAMPVFADETLPDAMPDTDLMMMDGQFLIDGFDGTQDLSFLDENF